MDATVVNAGVSGDTTAGGLARLDWALRPGTDAMIVALGGNDLLRGLAPETSRANLDAILARVAGEDGLPVLLVGIEAPGNYGAAYQAAFDAMYPEVAATYGAAVEPSFLGALTADLPLAEAPRALPAGGRHPSEPRGRGADRGRAGARGGGFGGEGRGGGLRAGIGVARRRGRRGDLGAGSVARGEACGPVPAGPPRPRPVRRGRVAAQGWGGVRGARADGPDRFDRVAHGRMTARRSPGRAAHLPHASGATSPRPRR